VTAFLKKCATCTRVYLYRVYDVKNTAAADHSHRATKLAVPFRSGRCLVGSAGHVDGVVVSIVGAHLQKFKESTLIDFARCAGTSVPHTSGFVQTRQEAADEHPGRRSCHTAASAKKKPHYGEGAGPHDARKSTAPLHIKPAQTIVAEGLHLKPDVRILRNGNAPR
jgi:hypothetical protein